MTRADHVAWEQQAQAAGNETELTRKCEARARRLANLRPVQKGQILNPRGRPKKDLDLAAMAQRHAELAVETLAQCLTDPAASWPAKISAASELLDRGFGRAPQSLAVAYEIGFAEQFEEFLREIEGSRRAKKKDYVIEADARSTPESEN